MSTNIWIGFLCSALLSSPSANARQEPKRLTSVQEPSSSKLVFLYATVRNKKGAYVDGLEKSAFRLRSQKEVQDISFFSTQSPRTSIALLYDVSGSMKQTKQAFQRAARDGVANFLKHGNRTSEYSLVFFSGAPTAPFEWTHNTAPLVDAVNKNTAIKQRGFTALYDACVRAIEELDRRDAERRVLILVTDGQDSASKADFSKLKEILKKSDTLVYWVVVRTEVFDMLADRILSTLGDFSKISGGATLTATTPSEVGAAFENLSTLLEHQYRIGFSPKSGPDTKWHPIELIVEVQSQDNPRKNVRYLAQTRQGHYATARP